MNREEQRFHAAVAAMQTLVGAFHSDRDTATAFEKLAKEKGKFTAEALIESCTHYADALLAELDRTTVKQPLTVRPDADGWIAHVPGDPMPCDGEMEVRIRCADGYECGDTAEFWSGSHDGIDLWTGRGADRDAQIIAWKPA